VLIVTTPVHDKLWNAAQTAAYNVFVLEGGSRSSKTHSIIQFWIKYAYVHKGRPKRVIVTRQKATWLTGTVLKDFLDILKAYGLYDKRNHNKSTGAGIYKLYDTEFWFMGLDDSQRIHGMASDAFWINEAVEAQFDDYAQLMQRCTGFAILDYNPSYEEHWIFDKILKRPKTYYSHSTMLDNPFIAANAKEQILSYEPTDENYANGTADKRKWKIYGLGQRAALEGLIFENWDIVAAIPPDYYNKHHRYGLDFGYTNDVTALSDVVWMGIEVWLDELCYQTKMLNTDIGNLIKANNLQTVKGYGDSAEPKSIDEIYKMGINIHPVIKYPGSIVQGIDVMKRYKIHITERSINLIKEFRNYTWAQDKTGKWLNVPIDKYNHGIDGSRYVFMSELDVKREQKQLTKQQLGFY
jgi:phage terminase large subunit